jgi:hypothetical protein
MAPPTAQQVVAVAKRELSDPANLKLLRALGVFFGSVFVFRVAGEALFAV